MVREPPRVVRTDPASGPAGACLSASIVDVAPYVPAAQLPQLLHLELDEHVIAVDDVSVHSDLEAGSRIAQIDSRSPACAGSLHLCPNRFVDLTVAGMAGSRRVLVLLH